MIATIALWVLVSVAILGALLLAPVVYLTIGAVICKTLEWLDPSKEPDPPPEAAKLAALWPFWVLLYPIFLVVCVVQWAARRQIASRYARLVVRSGSWWERRR